MPANEALEAVYAMMRTMSPADLSVLGEGCRRVADGEEVMLSTASGSPNDLLWAEMARLGWMTPAEDEEPRAFGRRDTAPPVRRYQLRAEGRAPVEALLQAMKPTKPAGAVSRMAELNNGLCKEFAGRLLAEVRDGGGSPVDLITLTGLLTAHVLRIGVAQAQHERALDEVIATARKSLAT